MEEWDRIRKLTGPEYGAALSEMSREDLQTFLAWKSQEQRKIANKKKGQKAAKTRSRKSAELAQKLSTPEGQRFHDAEQKIQSLIRLDQSVGIGHVKDMEFNAAQTELAIAAKAYRLMQSSHHPHPQDVRCDDNQPDMDLSTGKDPLKAERVNGLPWIVVDYEGNEVIISGAEISDSVMRNQERVLLLYTTQHMMGDRDPRFQIHFPKGDRSLSQKARRLVWEIATGKHQKMGLDDLRDLLLGDKYRDYASRGRTGSTRISHHAKDVALSGDAIAV